MTPKPLPEWIEKENPSVSRSLHGPCDESKIKLIETLAIAWEAFNAIIRQQENNPGDRAEDIIAKDAMRRIEDLGQ